MSAPANDAAGAALRAVLDTGDHVQPAKYADDPQYRERFRREALAAASLNQLRIVMILDVGEVDNRLFVTMPVIESRDLARRSACRHD